ncbi:MAG TPA: CHAT domain-containing protein [Solirubrobacteraceae bacterium]
MSADLSIMVQPSPSVDTQGPTILVEERGVWRKTIPTTGSSVSILALRRDFNKALYAAVANAGGVANPLASLRLQAGNLCNALLPKELIERLHESADGNGSAPVLRIHTDEDAEWVPWEMLHDGNDWLGLRFRIARLPIVAEPPSQPEDCKRPVSKVRSVLGKAVAAPPNGDFKFWRETFDDLLPAGMEPERVPVGQDDAGWPDVDALNQEADILHVTCHGLRAPESGPYWTLDPDRPQAFYAYSLMASQLSGMASRLGRRHPLVFGNACSPGGADLPDDAEKPPLATAFFRSGVLNFVGTLAPIRKALALRFARMFYESLLGDGVPVADALLAAKQRCAADDEKKTDPTYLLYCLYGPPETRYVPQGGDG